MSNTMPAIFFGHGNPMNALADNGWTRGWAELGRKTPKPRAILMISAHWTTDGSAVTANARPRTLHDFGGFPPELFARQYPAPGAPELARQVQQVLAPTGVSPDQRWGLDHGTWAVLCHVYPGADVPVVQLSLDGHLSAAEHYALGRRLAPLRDEGVLVAASGNLVHNLRAYAWGRADVPPYDWAVRFEQQARALIEAGDHEPLIRYTSLGRDAQLSAPTPEHYLPLLYILALQRPGEPVSFPVEGVEGGALSMLSVQIG